MTVNPCGWKSSVPHAYWGITLICMFSLLLSTPFFLYHHPSVSLSRSSLSPVTSTPMVWPTERPGPPQWSSSSLPFSCLWSSTSSSELQPHLLLEDCDLPPQEKWKGRQKEGNGGPTQWEQEDQHYVDLHCSDVWSLLVAPEHRQCYLWLMSRGADELLPWPGSCDLPLDCYGFHMHKSSILWLSQ